MPETTTIEKNKKKAEDNFKNASKKFKILDELESDFSISRFAVKEDDILFVIPYAGEIKNLIMKAHRSESNHYDPDETVKQLMEMRIQWNGMGNRVKSELTKCSCRLMVKKTHKKPLKFYRRIISNKPKERFQADTN